MALETANKINELVSTNPDGADRVRDGDNHLRLLKQVLLNSVGATGDLIAVFDTRDLAVAATGLNEGTHVRTAGQTALGDGKGAFYVVVAPGTGVADGVNYIDLTGSTGQLRLIHQDETTVIKYETFTATTAQTVFNLANAYEVGANALMVFNNGVRQHTPRDYAETDSTTITFGSGLESGTLVDVYTVQLQSVFLTELEAAIAALETGKSDTSHTHPYLAIASNLSDVNDPAAAFANIKQAATTAATGVVEQATQAETDAGTAGKFPDAAAIKAAAFIGKAASGALGNTGWWKDEDTGLVIQWGTTANINNDSNAWINSPSGFATPFPNNCFGVIGCITSTDATGGPATDAYLGVRKLNTTTFQYRTNALVGNNQIAYIAIGN